MSSRREASGPKAAMTRADAGDGGRAGSRLYRIETWGCQMNVHDSEKMAASLRLAGYRRAEEDEAPDVVVLNTCSVREKAQEKVFARVAQLRSAPRRGTPGRSGPGRVAPRIGVAGCVAQQEGDQIFARTDAVDFVLGTQSLVALPDVIRRLENGETRIVETDRRPDNLDIPPERIERVPGVKAYITIMEGCDNFCSFCVVPFTRGRERCRPVPAIVREAESLAADGFREIQLLGQNVNSYRDPETGTSFAGLIDAVAEVEGIWRLRFTSPHPKDFGPDLMERFARGGALAPHMHLPAQSGSTSTLGRMRRGYSREDFLRLAEDAREAAPGLALSTDLIVGFCGETDAEFEDTLTLLDEVRFSSVFSFQYSERPYTSALRALSDDVPGPVKSERLSVLQERQRGIQIDLNRALVGSETEVLVEGPSRRGGLLTGRGPDNRVVNFPGPVEWAGELRRVEVTGYGPNSLLGNPVEGDGAPVLLPVIAEAEVRAEDSPERGTPWKSK